jgi:hypothetical protein
MRRATLAAVLCFLALPAAAVEPASEWSARKDANLWQGRWRMAFVSGGAAKSLFGENPDYVQALAAAKSIQIDGDKLLLPSTAQSATLTNDLDLVEKQKQIENSVRGDRLVRFTLKSGPELLGSYSVSAESLTLRYPAGCCSRSGTVISYRREKP